MSRRSAVGLPIRIRLTIAFAIATAGMMVAAGWFVHARLRRDLDDAIDATLAARRSTAVDLIASSGSVAGFPLEDPEESFVVIVDEAGRTLDSVGLAVDPLAPGQIRLALGPPLRPTEAMVRGIEGRVRILVSPLAGAEPRTLIVGQSLINRDEALHDLFASFGLAGPVAIAAASLVGYALARLAFRPVEAMRGAAQQLSITGGGGRLPVPGVDDEVRRLAVTLNEMIERTEQAFAREQRFVADASHELRTPIAAIRLDLESALRSVDEHSPAVEPLRSALDESDSLGQLAEDLLVLARSAPDGLALSVERIGLAELLDATRDRFVDRAAQYGRTIRTRCDPLVVEADPVRLRQALSNLVDNALRHGDGQIDLVGRASGATVEIDVRDSGGGFDLDAAAHAFERFARGAAARAGSGAGLGLAIVETIMRAHQGSVAIVPGSPTTVRLTLPSPHDPAHG